jgi:hypothetical protein
VAAWNEWARTPGSADTVATLLQATEARSEAVTELCGAPSSVEEAEQFEANDCVHNVSSAKAERAALLWRRIYVLRREVAHLALLDAICRTGTDSACSGVLEQQRQQRVQLLQQFTPTTLAESFFVCDLLSATRDSRSD